VCGSALEWRTIRAIPSEPALTPETTQQFFKPYGTEIHFPNPTSTQNKKTVGQAHSPNTTTSCLSRASREAKPAASPSASSLSHAEASYAALNPEPSSLFATMPISPLAPNKRDTHSKTLPFPPKSHGQNHDSANQP